jgi:hypothetical protein
MGDEKPFFSPKDGDWMSWIKIYKNDRSNRADVFFARKCGREPRHMVI